MLVQPDLDEGTRAALRSMIASDVGERNNLGYPAARICADFIATAAVKHWPINPLWFAHGIVAIGARETAWRNLRQQGGNGRGYLQVDPSSGTVLTDEQAMDPCTNIDAGAAILASALGEFYPNTHAGFARYNCGRAGILKGLAAGNVDLHTTGGNYGAYVLRRLAEIDPNPEKSTP